ncbi:MAG: glycosyltransferase, partial [Chloroflexi bacterium]|nr:glycosyltransferase [Chloroflexota bacterium]
LKKMRVLHIIPSIGPQRGGMSRAALDMCQLLAAAGIDVTLVTTDDDGPNGRLNVPLNQLKNEEYRTIYFSRQTRVYSISMPLLGWVNAHVHEFDVCHLHGVFSFASDLPALAARRANVPYVITPHGILCNYGMMQRRSFLKRLFVKTLVGPNLQQALLVHFTTEMERRESSGWADIRRSEIVPYCLDLQMALPRTTSYRHRVDQVFKLLFLSRIDPKKGLDLLFRALAQLHRDDVAVTLTIAGSGEASYIATLKTLAAELGIANQIHWAGFADEIRKQQLFGEADAFVLSSYSENFGIAPVEAMTAGLPVIITDQTAVSEAMAATDAAIVIPCDVDALATAIRQLRASPAMQARLSHVGLQLARNYFSSSATIAKWVKIYSQWSMVNA